MREGVKWWVKEGVKKGVNLTLDQLCTCEGGTHCAMRQLLMASDGLKNVTFIE